MNKNNFRNFSIPIIFNYEYQRKTLKVRVKAKWSDNFSSKNNYSLG